MANFEIDEDQAALIRELRKLETSDPVHANVYNALFEKLINNDAFLERLANKMVEKSMLCHVLDSVNAQQVLAADVGPKITAITNELKENVSVLNTNKAPLNEFIWLRDAFNGRYNTAFISDANVATTSGFYRYYANSANTPWTGGGTLFTLAFDGGSGIVQITFFNGSPAAASLRARYDNTWTGWKAL